DAQGWGDARFYSTMRVAGPACVAREETCDGTDEDCDGAIDEEADASCGEGSACTADGCLELMRPPPEPMLPPVDETDGVIPPRRTAGMSDGCACDAAGAPGTLPPGAPLALLAFLGVVVVLRRSAR
ncbi:MAG: MYXO-CTERM sorting domain-containing protein, partial [Myxococcota bacterium]|nr:MYXO-CTERM sorting domain-containing protein [Myxococcota bacterium]